MSVQKELRSTIDDLVHEGRGILAMDESTGTIAKRFKAIAVESTEENRCAYRSLLLTTHGLGEYINGVILFEETLTQKTNDGALLPKVAWEQKIVPGIKVDKGKIPLAMCPGDNITEGLDGLAQRLKTYREQGARFAKWRAVYSITERNPGSTGIQANAEALARYAAICQDAGLVPIVEPEVLMDGSHTIERCADVTESVLQSVFAALARYRVMLELMILKTNMVLPGVELPKATPDEIAASTGTVLRRTVPAAVPSINFLSGGQQPDEATANLNALCRHRDRYPWHLSISFGRALQQPALLAWKGKVDNLVAAQQALLKRARLNSLAMRGEYSSEMEQ